MSRFLLLIALAALGGCATTSSEYYRDGRYYGDAGYSAGYYADDGYYAERYDDGGYAGGDYYYGEYYDGGYGYTPDYLLWPTYYSIFWPINHWYVDPYYYPGYYYGVTYFPRDYWSLSLTWGNHYRYGYAYTGYWNYSPYRHSWADNYYDWYPWHRQHSRHRDHHEQRPRYGSARNEAERVMALRHQDRRQLGSAAYRNAGVRSPATTAVDRGGPRAAYYPSQQGSNAVSTSRGARSGAVDRERASRQELLRNAQYRRQLQNGKPASNSFEDRRAVGTLDRGGSRSLAKPATERPVRRNSSTMMDAAQDVRRFRNDGTTPESRVPARIRYSNSVRAGEAQGAGTSTRPREAADSRVSTGGRVYRSAPLPSTRPTAPIPSRSSATYRAAPRAVVREPASQAVRVEPRSYSVEPRQYQRPASVRTPSQVRSTASGSYRAPPAVGNTSAPAANSSSGGGAHATSGKSSKRSSSGSRVRAARSARGRDD